MDKGSLQEFSELVSALKVIDAEIHALNKQREKHLGKCARRIPVLLRNRLDAWNPEIGDSMVRVSLEKGIAYELIVREVSGRTLRAQEGGKECYHRVDLELPAEEYEVADLLMPVDLYCALKPYLSVVFLPTILGGCANFPDWA